MSSYGPVQWSKTASLNSSADVNVYVAEGMAPSATNDQFRSIMQSFSKFRDDNNGTLITGGSSTAATLATNEVFTALKTGLTVTFSLTTKLSSGATLAVDGLTATVLQIYAGTSITTGTLASTGSIVSATYNASGVLPACWVVQSSIQGGVGNLMTLTGKDQKISGGAKTPFHAVTTSTAVQIDYGKGPLQVMQNNAAFVLSAPAADGYCTFFVYNGATAGTVATSGFTVSAFTGDAVGNSVNAYYFWNLMTINGTSTYMIKALK